MNNIVALRIFARTPSRIRRRVKIYDVGNWFIRVIMTLYENTKVKVRSPDGVTDYFDIVARVLQEDTLSPYLIIICLDYVLRTSTDKMKDNGFKQAKEISRRYPVQAKAGRPTRTYIQQLCTDTGCGLEDLLGVMDDRDGWQERFREIPAGGGK